MSTSSGTKGKRKGTVKKRSRGSKAGIKGNGPSGGILGEDTTPMLMKTAEEECFRVVKMVFGVSDHS